MTHAFYHIAAINHWREIVAEQLGVLARTGFATDPDCRLYINVCGPEFEQGFVQDIIAKHHYENVFIRTEDALHQYEFPALRLMESVARTLPSSDRIIYFHTKSVSHPNNWARAVWRWYMNFVVLDGYKRGLAALEDNVHNCYGTGWLSQCWPTSMFPGTFWMATAELVQSLQPFDEYLIAFDQMLKDNPGRGLNLRHAAEHWIQSRASCRPFNVGPSPSRFWDPNFYLSQPDLIKQAITYGLP